MGKKLARVGSTLLLVAGLAMAFAASASATGEITEYNYPSNSEFTPREMTVGPDGNVWTVMHRVESNVLRLLKTTPAGAHTEYKSMEWECPAAGDIVTGSDNNLWFACPGVKKLARFTTAGVITYFPLPTTGINQLARGTEGNLWYAGPAGVGKITPAGVATPFVSYAGAPSDIEVAPDGSAWVSYNGNVSPNTADKIVRFTTGGVATTFTLPANTWVNKLTVGPDGNIWYTADSSGLTKPAVGKLTPAGVNTSYPVEKGRAPWEIVSGPDKNLWFTDQYKGYVTRITTAGVMTAYKPSGVVPRTQPIVSGPGGKLWFGVSTVKIPTGGTPLLFPGKIGTIVP
jgi:virginiamycin B lyase